MNKQLIGWALSLAVALTASGNLALAANGNANSNATNNTNGNASSNEGTHVGSNEGTHVGSNEGINNPTNTTNNIPRANNNNNMNRGPGTNFSPGNGVGDGIIVGGGTVIGGATGNSGTAVDPNSVGANGVPLDSGQHPANGSTPPPTGPITNNGALTTANVPPPASANNNAGMALAPASRHAQIEGRLVDLLSVSQEYQSAGNTTPAANGANGVNGANAATVSPPLTPAVGETTPAATPSSPTTAAPTNVVTPKSGATSASTPGSTEATASVRTNAGDSFGTYSRRGATRAPETATPPANSTANSTANNNTGPVGTTATGTGPSIIIGDNSKPTANSGANSAANAAPALDNSTISRELSAGMPAAILANNRLYILACDPKQLASYGGQTLRISGKLTPAGTVIPDRVEARQTAGAFKQIPLSTPTGTASER